MEPTEQKPRSVVRIPLKKTVGAIILFVLIYIALFVFVATGNRYASGNENVYLTTNIFALVLFGISILFVLFGLFADNKKNFIFFGVITMIVSAVLWAGAQSFFNPSYPRAYSTAESKSGAPAYDLPMVSVGDSSAIPSIAPDYYRGGYGYGQPDITDTREFLKLSYNAQIKSLDVSKTIRDVKGAVREVEGRIDGEQSSEKNGYVSFVVPKARFDEFRDTVESITNKKLYTENVSSQNLLNQKQGIEQQMQNATATLAAYEKQKKDIDSKHTVTINSIKKELTTIQAQLVTVRQNINNAQDESQRAAYQSEESVLVNRQAVLVANQSTENEKYKAQTQSIDAQIKYAKDRIAGVEKQDTQFGNNIETVTGYVSVNQISWWDYVTALSPIHPAAIAIVILLVIGFFLYKKGYTPKIEFV